MRIVSAFPPNYAELKRRFGFRHDDGVLFAFGDTIYNPKRIEVTPSLLAHEQAHGERQTPYGVIAWWRRYIDQADFRLAEELVAHQAEFQKFRADRPLEADAYLTACAAKLASPLYGRLISPSDAAKLIAA